MSVYASRWIENLATIADSLWKLTRDSSRWERNDEHQNSFDLIKNTLIDKIGNYDLSWNTAVTVDARPVALAAVLTRSNPLNDKDQKVIIYVSISLSKTER